MHLLEGALRSYAWGSRTAIASLRGLPIPTPHPEAELWLGAHPGDPARIVTAAEARSLLDVVNEDPVGELGSDTVAAFGERLPFLLKLLAAEEPLSLQAHPSAEQAREGYAKENAADLALDSSLRNYRDSYHKPELVVALSRFEALAGFRDPSRTVKLLSAIDVPELEPYAGLLAGQPDSEGLRALFTTWITLPQPVLASLLPAVLEGCIGYLSAGGGSEFVAEVRTALELGEAYPGDAGVLASLLLNRITLEPGQGLYLDAGNLHAYLHGMAVEIMANSDNVLRGGLTPKHVDVPELLKVLDFESLDIPVLESEQVGASAEFAYETPAPEFALSRLEFDPEDGNRRTYTVQGGGPRILLCTAGRAGVTSGDKGLDLPKGAAVWLSAADGAVTVEGFEPNTQVFSAVVGTSVA